jgi:hypothetical protein
MESKIVHNMILFRITETVEMQHYSLLVYGEDLMLTTESHQRQLGLWFAFPKRKEA